MESRKIFRFEFNNYKMFLFPILYVLTTMTIFYLIPQNRISASLQLAVAGIHPAFLPKGPFECEAVVEPVDQC